MERAKASVFRMADVSDSALLRMVFVQLQHQCALGKAAREASSQVGALQQRSSEAQSRHLRVLFAKGDAALLRVYFDAFKDAARTAKRIQKQEGLMLRFASSNDRFLLSSVFGEWASVAQHARKEAEKTAMQEKARMEKMGQAKACLFRMADAADSALLHMVFVQLQHQCALGKAAREASSQLNALKEQSLEAQTRHLR